MYSSTPNDIDNQLIAFNKPYWLRHKQCLHINQDRKMIHELNEILAV